MGKFKKKDLRVIYQGKKRIYCEYPADIEKKIIRDLRLRGDVIFEEFYEKTQKWVAVSLQHVPDLGTVRVREISTLKRRFTSTELTKDDKLKAKLKNGEQLTGIDRSYLYSRFAKEEPHPPKKPRLLPQIVTPKPIAKRNIGTQTIACKPPPVKSKPPENEVPQKRKITQKDVIRFLKMEATKDEASRDYVNIDDSMNASYLNRRTFIFEEEPEIKKIKEIYPILFESRQILSEFQRVHTQRVCEKYHANLTLYAPKILKCESVNLKLRRIIRDTLKENDDLRKHIRKVGALLLLPSLYDEDYKRIITFKAEEPVCHYPEIVCKQSLMDILRNKRVKFKIFADRELICKAYSLDIAVLLYVAVFSVFNMCYPRKLIKTLHVIANVFTNLDINDQDRTNEEIVQDFKDLLD